MGASAAAVDSASGTKLSKTKTTPAVTTGATTKRRLSFKEQKELESLPDRIAELEEQLSAEQALMADPQFYKQPGEVLAEQQAKLQQLEAKIASSYARLEELE